MGVGLNDCYAKEKGVSAGFACVVPAKAGIQFGGGGTKRRKKEEAGFPRSRE
jgi:hypothetical protein